MKFLDEYRDPAAAQQMAAAIAGITTRPWSIMEICGGQTHAIVKFGIDRMLPECITLVHGPGCPVCVTATQTIDQAIEIAQRQGVILCSFGDMLRVPGSRDPDRPSDLLAVKAGGGDVRAVYSPLDALKIARQNPEKEVVFFAVGFETTAPANAMSVYQAAKTGVTNFSILVSHVLVPPAMEAILSSPINRIQGFLAAGHVCTVMGFNEYDPIAARYRVPIVVTGFEPLDILHGIFLCVKQLEEGRYEVENQYTRAVVREGNRTAQNIITEVFEIVPRKWRGIGEIPKSGLGLRPPYHAFDADLKFGATLRSVEEDSECISGLVMQGVKKPSECPAFGVRCTPERPLGAPMVSTEGACAAYYRYRGIELPIVAARAMSASAEPVAAAAGRSGL